MNAQFLYLTDPLTLEFEAEIRETLEFPDGRMGLILTRTYFYPTGGGQDHDTGTIGAVRVLDVFKSEDGESVIHVVDSAPREGRVHATIDRTRRLRHMQHHTGQHLLSSCCDKLLGLETLSSSIHGEIPTTIDLPDVELSTTDLNRLEDLANQIIFENRTVKSYFVPSEKIDTVPLRRPPKVEGEIRIVEIEGFDYSACGATHCPQTGMIGLIKIVRTERINQKLRLHFVAGDQALGYFRQYQQIATTLAAEMSTHPIEVVELVHKQAAQLQSAEKELRQLRLAYSAFEAQDLLVHAEHIGALKVIFKIFEERLVSEIRTLANEFKSQPELVSLLASFDGSKLVLVVTCGLETGLSARELLNRFLAMIGGRGGGDDQIAQGGGAATPEQFQAFLEGTRETLQSL